jgi:hypothetical protein
MWNDFFRDGGWGMYPTTLFGFFLVASAVLLLLRPERRWVPLVVSLGVMTFGAGLLGTATGLINTFRYVQKVPLPDQVQIASLGCAESLNNVVLALVIVVFSTLLATVAALRASLVPRAAR